VVGNKKYLRPELTLESFALDHIVMASTSTDTAAEGPTVYVDEQIGSDEAGDGSIQKPYASAAHAIVTHGACPPLIILTRKKEDEEWAQIGISALKKARKGAEGIEKKRKKAQEAEAKAADKAAEQDKAKSIVLVEDESLPKAVKVRSLPYLGWHIFTIFDRRRSSIWSSTEVNESESLDGFTDYVLRER
jgi:hypothetical protein